MAKAILIKRFSTASRLHVYRHEFGHAIFEYLKRLHKKKKNTGKSAALTQKLYDIKKSYPIDKMTESLSSRAAHSIDEMVAESFAEYWNGNPRELAKTIVDLIKKEIRDAL